LLFATEKFAAHNEILRLENTGLRNAVIVEKKKRKRGKAMKFYEENEPAGQALFFNPAKVGRLRVRQAKSEEAETQKQRDKHNKKF
jgi:hypothetical protein